MEVVDAVIRQIDVRLRLLLKHPREFIAVLTLARDLAPNGDFLSGKTLLLRPLPYADPDRS